MNKQPVKWSCEAAYDVDNFPALAASESEGDPAAEIVPLTKMTVGRKLLLKCQGEPVFFARNKLVVLNGENAPAMIQLLEVRRLDEKSGDFVVTSYKAGKHEVNGLRLTDGDLIAELGGETIVVESVIKAKDGKPPEPYGAYGPIQLQWPLFMWIVLAAAVVGALIFLGVRLWKHTQRRKMLEELKKFDTALSPFDQFNLELRKLKRNLEFSNFKETTSYAEMVSLIEKSMRLYLLREWRLPAHEWSEEKIHQDMKKRHRKFHDLSREDLTEVFRELRKAQQDRAKLTAQEVLLLLAITQRKVTQVWRTRQQLIKNVSTND